MSETNNAREDSADSGQDLAPESAEPESLRDRLKGVAMGLLFFLLGAGWMWAGHRWVPTWAIDEVYSHGSGIPVWTFGMYLVVIGLVVAGTAPLPRLRGWLSRHMGFNIFASIAAVILWMVVCAWAGFIKD